MAKGRGLVLLRAVVRPLETLEDGVESNGVGTHCSVLKESVNRLATSCAPGGGFWGWRRKGLGLRLRPCLRWRRSKMASPPVLWLRFRLDDFDGIRCGGEVGRGPAVAGVCVSLSAPWAVRSAFSLTKSAASPEMGVDANDEV